MALIIETIRCRHKQNKDLVITLLDLGASDEDYRGPVYVYKTDDLYARWYVSFNKNFFNEWEEIKEEE